MSMAGKCKVVSGRNGKRKICWGANGKIKSNTRASGTAGLGGRKRSLVKRLAKRRAKKRGATPRSAGVKGLGSSRKSSAATFVAKASFARTKAGKLRKGCKKVGSVYRCRRPGK